MQIIGIMDEEESYLVQHINDLDSQEGFAKEVDKNTPVLSYHRRTRASYVYN